MANIYFRNTASMLSADKRENVIHSTKLQGHKGDVLCLDHSSSLRQGQCSPGGASALLSGSEDRTCRLWDLRSQRTSVCMTCPGEVLSVAFGPSQHAELTREDTGTYSLSKDYVVYAAAANNVYGYDLRNVSGPIVTQPTVTVMSSIDEVNQILFSKTQLPKQHTPTRWVKNRKGGDRCKNRHKSKANRSETPPGSADEERKPDQEDQGSASLKTHMLAAADDSGVVRVIENYFADDNAPVFKLESEKMFNHGSEHAPAMVTAISFRPQIISNYGRNSNPLNILASGGTDCQIKLWDASATNKSALLQTLLISNSDTSANQVCNPPMVHNLSWSPSGRLLAAALGDGSICLWQASSGNTSSNFLVMTARLEDAHSGSVAFCLFPSWNRAGNKAKYNDNTYIHDRLLCTAGNDCNIVFWDLGATVCGEKALNPVSLLQQTDVTSIGLEKLSLSDDGDAMSSIDQPKALFRISHGTKPNWIACSRRQDVLFPSSIFIADTSPDITCYTIPLK